MELRFTIIGQDLQSAICNGDVSIRVKNSFGRYWDKKGKHIVDYQKLPLIMEITMVIYQTYQPNGSFCTNS